MQIAEDLGYKVERRPIPVTELDQFEEAGIRYSCCYLPIQRIDDIDTGKSYATLWMEKQVPSLTLRDPYGIQYGELEDKHGLGTQFRLMAFVDKNN